MSTAPILFVDHARALGGAEHALLHLFDTIDRGRFILHLATRPGQLADAARVRGVLVHEVALARLRRGGAAPWHLACGVGALLRVIRREGVVLVHTNTQRASVYAALAARLTRRPLVWHVHDIHPGGLYVRMMCALSDAAIAVSTAAAAPLPCQHKVTVVHNGVRLDDFSRNRTADARRLRAAWGVPHEAILIGQVARLQPWKGQRDVIAAAAAICRDNPQVYVVIVGGDIFNDAREYVAELTSRVAQLGLTERVRFAGHVDDVPAALQALDVVVHASTDEPFGRILIEAGAAGLPVVAYGSGAVPEIIVHEETGLIVPTGDRAALATALVRLVRNAALLHHLADAGRARVGACFEVRQRTVEIAQVYERLLRGLTPARTGASSA